MKESEEMRRLIRFRTMFMSAIMTMIMVLTLATPILAASNDIWFSHVKFVPQDENNFLQFYLSSNELFDGNAHEVEILDQNGTVIGRLSEGSCEPPGEPTECLNYAYESVVENTYNPVQLRWGELLSTPLYEELDVSGNKIAFYAEGINLDIQPHMYARFQLRHPSIGDIYYPLFVEGPVYQEARPAPYMVIDLDTLDNRIHNYFNFYLDLDIEPTDYDIKIPIFASQLVQGVGQNLIYIVSLDRAKVGQIISLEAPSSILQLDVPENWSVDDVNVIVKDEFGRQIISQSYEYLLDEESPEMLLLPDGYYYDIQIIGSIDDGVEGELFLLTKKNVKPVAYETTIVEFNTDDDDTIFVAPMFDWTDTGHEYLVEEDFQLDSISLIPMDVMYDDWFSYFPQYIDLAWTYSEVDFTKLYITKGMYSEMVWQYCIDGYYGCFEYFTSIPENGGHIAMSNELESSLQFKTLYLSSDEVVDVEFDIIPILFNMQLQDSYGNEVLPDYDGLGRLRFREVGEVSFDAGWHIHWPEEWVGDYESGFEVKNKEEGLYEIVHEIDLFNVQMKQPYYLYYLSEEALQSKIAEAGLRLDEFIDLQRIVQSMRNDEFADFWPDNNEALKSYHIRLLMQFIDSVL